MTSNALSKIFNFSGRRVLVTGGAGGMGLTTAKLFDQFKAEVFVFDKDQAALDALARDLPSVKAIKVDLSDWEATRKATEAILPIHHLVNNAVISKGQSVLDIDESTVDRMFAVNYKAVLNVSQVVAKGLIRHEIKNGTIVNMSSILDTSAVKNGTAYSSTKGALVMLSRNLALELGQFGIRVNWVRPTLVNTPLIANLPSDRRDTLSNHFLDQMPFKRLPEPVEVSRAVVFLSSEWASMTTGTSLTIDGGFEIS